MSEDKNTEEILIEALINMSNNRFERADENMYRVKDNLSETINKLENRILNTRHMMEKQHNAQMVYCLLMLILYIISIGLFIKFYF